MINKNFWDLLAEKQDSLTKSGTIIADYLTKHAEEAQFLSISSLAKACNMAEATIYRFCKQLGFEGYNEMKISLAQANVTPTPFSSYSLDPSMPTSSLCDNVCASFQAAISNTMSVLDFDAIDEAAILLNAQPPFTVSVRVAAGFWQMTSGCASPRSPINSATVVTATRN